MENAVTKQKTEEIAVICAWCKKDLGAKEVVFNEKMAGAPSHGICPKCFEELQGDLK